MVINLEKLSQPFRRFDRRTEPAGGVNTDLIQGAQKGLLKFRGLGRQQALDFLYKRGAYKDAPRPDLVLLDLKDPTRVLSRTTDALFEPAEAYEVKGQVNYVVFPCGAVVRKGVIYMYYGGGDSVIDVASISLQDLLNVLVK